MANANDTSTGPRIAPAFASTEVYGGNVLFIKVTTVTANFPLVTGGASDANKLAILRAIAVKGEPMLVGQPYSVATDDVLTFAITANSGWTSGDIVTALGVAGITATADVRDYLF